MATRTLPSDHDRRMTVMLTPFMSCSAKLPVYGLLTAAFFPRYGGLVMAAMYLMGILVGILVALVLKRSAFRGDPVPSSWSCRTTVCRAWGRWHVSHGTRARASCARRSRSCSLRPSSSGSCRRSTSASTWSPISPRAACRRGPGAGAHLRAARLCDWRASTALAAGFAAKESVVSTLTVLLGGDVSALSTLFTPLTAFCFLTFTLLYTPCVAAVSTVRSELGTRMMLGRGRPAVRRRLDRIVRGAPDRHGCRIGIAARPATS